MDIDKSDLAEYAVMEKRAVTFMLSTMLEFDAAFEDKILGDSTLENMMRSKSVLKDNLAPLVPIFSAALKMNKSDIDFMMEKYEPIVDKILLESEENANQTVN